MPTLLLASLIAVAALVALRVWRSRRRRHTLLATGLTDDQRAIVAACVPMAKTLPPGLRAAFEGKVALFLDQVSFIGRGGLDVTEEMRLTIAAQACLLIAGVDLWYETLRTVLVYPAAFTSNRREYDGVVMTERRIAREGESWARGPVVLSWEDSRHGALDTRDGHNVILHEFAHQLDNLTGNTDGAPPLPRARDEAGWDRTFIEAHARHRARVEQGEPTVLDPYAATNHQEFFAVAVENFFERPQALREAEPEVYGQLTKALGLDPAAWCR